jgi:hypothetical protein
VKTHSLIATLAILACAVSVPAMAKGPNVPAIPKTAAQTAVTVASIDAEEANILLWMREEEKMARDVYVNLYKLWKRPVFRRIANSEQRHFDAVGSKIDSYGLTDPAQPAIGQFANADLRAMYNQLLVSGGTSYIQALLVGATIEDVDIRDLQAAIEATDEAALKTTYQNLLEGSKNHLRAFVELLQDLGVTYTPQYIDPVLYDAIVGI